MGGGIEGEFFFAFVVTGGAGAFVAEIGEIVMAGVAVGPSDVDAGAGGDVDFYGGGFFPLIDGGRHWVDRQFTVYRRARKHESERRRN